MKLQRSVVGLAALLISLFFLAPVIWQVLTSLKTTAEIGSIPATYVPRTLTMEHYQQLFSRRPFGNYLCNSALVAFFSTLLSLLLGAPAAYMLRNKQLPFERVILAGIVIVSVFPYVLLFLGLLEVVKSLGVGNTHLALVVPYTAMNLPLTILVLRSFFLAIPSDLEDAALMDGFSRIQMLLRIIGPISVPALVTTGILTFIFSWNEYIFALTFITREGLKTVPVASAQLGGASVFEIPYGPIAAATVLATAPLVLLVFLFQKRIVQGLLAGAVKG